MRDEGESARGGSIVDPHYANREYFADPDRHREDAGFKARHFLKLFLPVARKNSLTISSYADVGCGSGEITKLVADSLRMAGFDLNRARGYDVSPHVRDIRRSGVEYVHADFCKAHECVDLVTLFDVLEHVPDPIRFIELVSARCQVLGFHIPLDNSINIGIRDLFRSKLRNPGHLIFMDTVYALNLLALAGLRVLDYSYTFAFRAPSGRTTVLSKAVLPLRVFLSKISPWLLSKTIGGASLMVVAVTPQGLRKMGCR